MTRRAKGPPFAVALGGILLVALVVRLVGLGDQSLWSDEGVTVANAFRPLAELPAALTRDVIPPLYYAFLHFWMRGGQSEFWIRLPSVVFSVLTIAASGAFLRRAASPAVALLASAWLALSAFQILYAQEARTHTLVALSLTVSCASLWMWAVEERRGFAASWFVGAVACMYANYFGYLVLPLQVLMLLSAGVPHRFWRSFALGAAGVAFCVLPWLVYIYPGLVAQARSQGYEGTSLSLGRLSAALFDIFYSHDFPTPQLSLEAMGAWTWILVLLALGVCLLGAARRDRTARWLAVWAFGPLAGAVLAELVLGIDVVVNKYFLLSTPALAGLFALGLSRLWRGRLELLALAVATVWLAVNLASAWEYATNPLYGNQNWKAVGGLLDEGAADPDVIVVQPAMMAFSLAWYYHGTARLAPVNTADEAGPALRGVRGRVWLVTVPGYEVVTRSPIPPPLAATHAPGHVWQTHNAHPAQEIYVQLFLLRPDQAASSSTVRPGAPRRRPARRPSMRSCRLGGMNTSASRTPATRATGSFRPTLSRM
jgi:4-amino-4-deoxy-L-arabinose transferase-like glycosyltransferase